MISKRKLTEYLSLVKGYKLHYLKVGDIEIQSTPQTYADKITDDVNIKKGPLTEEERLKELDRQLFPDDV